MYDFRTHVSNAVNLFKRFKKVSLGKFFLPSKFETSNFQNKIVCFTGESGCHSRTTHQDPDLSPNAKV